MATIDSAAYVTLTGIVEKDDGQFVSYCRELGTSNCGDTVEEAFANLGDAIDVHIDALIETGELSKVFRERHIRIDISTSLRRRALHQSTGWQDIDHVSEAGSVG